MAVSSRILTILFLVILFQEKLKAQFTLDTKPPDVVCVEAGKTLRLNVTFTYTGFFTLTLTWSFNGKALAQKIGDGKPVSALPERVDIEGQGSLVLKNTSLQDKGTYRFQWSGSAPGNDDFTVIITVQPTAMLNVSSPTTAQEHSDVYYSCEGKNGVPTSVVSWYKGNKLVVKGKILSLRNIKRDQAGSYTCNVQSGTLTDETELKIIVQFKPNITTFRSQSEMAILGKYFKITCKAEAVPEPDYIIYHNGTILAGVEDGVKIIQSVKHSDAGKYTCNAGNIHVNDARSFYLTVLAPSITEASTTMNPGTMSTRRTTDSVGMVFHYGIMSLRRRFKSKKDESKPGHDYDTPETHREDAADNSVYQELELRNREPESSYQALRMNTRRRMANETKIKDEAGNYQELDKVREDGNDYQSLNRA